MKNTFPRLTKLVAVAACALSLGSCNRAEYAMLPKGSSYHGVTRVAAPVPASRPVAMAPVAPEVVAEAAAPAPVTKEAAKETAPAPVAVAVQAPAAPAAKTTLTAAETATIATAVATPTAAPKMTRVQRFAATRLVKVASKVAGITQFKRTLDAAKTQRVSGNLRMGIILLLIGLLVSLFSGINRIFGVIGAVIAIIGLIFIILYLLDNL